MLEEIYDLGNFIKKKKNISEIEMFVDRAKLSKTKKVLCIAFEIQGGKVHYKGVEIEDYSDKNTFRYLYKGGSSRGTDITPSSLVPKDAISTFQNRILKWFENQDDDFLKSIHAAMLTNQNIIENELKEKYEMLEKSHKTNVLLTLKFYDPGEKYLSDFEIFKKILVASSKSKYYYLKSMGTSLGNGICYLCGEEKDVYGFVLPAFGFSFSTADKPGFIGDFVREERWKEIPICEGCAITLEVGKKYLDENLSFRFYGGRYYLIPQLLFPEKKDEILNEMFEYVEEHKGKEYHDGMVSDEDYLTEFVSEKGNVMKLIYVFYSMKGGGKYIDIMKYVEDVLPSHMRRIYESQDYVREKYGEEFVKTLFGKNAEGDFVEYYSKKRKLKGKTHNWYIVFGRSFFKGDKTFLEYVSSILSNKHIDRQYMISKFLDEIRSSFRNKNDFIFKLEVVESMMIHDFLNAMGLIRGDRMEEQVKMKISKEKIENFFEDRTDAFGTAAARATFLVGAIVNYLLDVQRKERGLNYGDEPFRSKLYSLNLDEKKVKKIFTAAVEKLREYKRATSLEKYAAEYLTIAGDGWNLSKDEVSYYFALGMVLGAGYFFEEVNNKGGEENGSE